MIELVYTLKILSPIKIGTGIGSAGLLDDTVVRDGSQKPIVPGSTIKGKSRAVVFRLASALGLDLHAPQEEPTGCLATRASPCVLCGIFGAPHWPGRLFFEPAVLDASTQSILDALDQERIRRNIRPLATQGFARHVRTSVAQGRRTRTALPDRLFTWEAIGRQAEFHGRIRGEIRAAGGGELETALLAAALEFISYLGGGRGRGLGRCAFSVEAVRIDGREVEPADRAQQLERSYRGNDHD